MWRWANTERTIVERETNGVHESRTLADREVRLWLADGNRPAEPEPGSPLYIQDHLPLNLGVKTIGGVRYTHYLFRKKGDALPWHDHKFTHFSTLMKGCARAQIEDTGMNRLMSNPVFDVVMFPAGSRHQITAEEDGTLIVQTQLAE